ncbi:MAG: dTDP-4-dehydrorhamnose 3,5-epimerase family protein [Deltaproteobacteria bacterium]|nr:dTDP-4-dehydrorhamnose 3,5-epimerase family protein [Deltaproteobacteria bacterium]
MIDGVIIQQLEQFHDARGSVMHMFRVDNPVFEKFGEVYFSEILPGAVKAWKRHKKMTQLFAVPTGMIKLVVYDDRKNSASKGKLAELDIGRDNYRLVKIPPQLIYGFKCISPFPALVANCTDLPHNPEEADTLDPNDPTIPYKW